MFCIGKKLVFVLSGVMVLIDGQMVMVKGLKGEKIFVFNDFVLVEMIDDGIKIDLWNFFKLVCFMWGMSCIMVVNLIMGVIEGFKKDFVIIGVGYCVQVQG